MGLMDEAKGLIDKAKELAGEHPDQVKEGLSKAEDLIDKQTGGKFTEQIHKGGDAIDNALSGDQPPAQQ